MSLSTTVEKKDAAAAWHEALENIRGRIHRQTFDTWFRPLRCTGNGDDGVHLAVPSKFHLDWISDNYLSFITEQLSGICGREVEVRLEIAPELATAVEEAAPASPERSAPSTGEVKAAPICRLNERYTFETFVTGPSNQFARAASQAVADKPAHAYNPLFIYGGTGLGKTHLLHAIGLQMLERERGTRVIYVSTEAFMNDMIDSVRHEKMEAFRARYRSQCDVLLVDDIQFLGGKDRTQEEFFHTFNHLYESERQIVITCDKLPHEIPGIEERLRTRFQCGLLVDIKPPEMETRVAILRNKAETEKITLPDDVALFLATNITSNVRELEGSLIRLQAFASMYHAPITLELAREQLKSLASAPERALSPEHIQKLVANYFSLKVSDLRSQRRHRAVSLPRQIAMFLCRKHCHLSFPEIGERFGGKDHTTVISAVRKIETSLGNDGDIKKSVEAIETSLLV
ncbi:MAG: chromosomal replication initiator protein DnaA [Deltaproteobacteria bacterium]|nr:chromosomal replication initiator protein DnaA [Deltaproteobacteria bacterium]